jgi:hypothetical protein
MRAITFITLLFLPASRSVCKYLFVHSMVTKPRKQSIWDTGIIQRENTKSWRVYLAVCIVSSVVVGLLGFLFLTHYHNTRTVDRPDAEKLVEAPLTKEYSTAYWR